MKESWFIRKVSETKPSSEDDGQILLKHYRGWRLVTLGTLAILKHYWLNILNMENKNNENKKQIRKVY